MSNSPLVQSGSAWDTTNFALSTGVEVASFILDLIEKVKCGCVPGVCDACEAIQSAVMTALAIIGQVIETVSAVVCGRRRFSPFALPFLCYLTGTDKTQHLTLSWLRHLPPLYLRTIDYYGFNA